MVEVCERLPVGNTYPQIYDAEGRHVGGFAKLRDRIDEPMLNESFSRFSCIPVRMHDIWQMYKKAQAVNWVAEEIDFSLDLHDWSTLKSEEQHFLKRILAFFSCADGIVQENLMMNFMLEVQYAEARAFYSHQGYIEQVHNETYGTLLATYITDEEERDSLMNAIMTLQSVKNKAGWAMKWMDSSRPFAERLVAFICFEGIMFSGSFCAIFWIKQKGRLPSLTLSNDFIARDEGMHQQFGELLYNAHLKHKLPQDTIHQIVREAVGTEIEFITDAIPENMCDPHLDRAKMVTYIQYVADRIIQVLGYQPLFKAKQPFDFMEAICLRSISSFFERRSEVYRDSKVCVTRADEPVFDRVDEDF